MIYSYAHYLEEFFGHSAVIFYDQTNPNTSDLALEKFKRRFEIVGYERFADLDAFLERSAVDYLHMTKSGEIDGKLPSEVPAWIHAVFPQTADAVHGQRYAFVSEWLSQACSNGAIPWVPGIIDFEALDGDMRDDLNIPRDAFVVGYHGGRDSFDIEFVQSALVEALTRRRDLYAIFMNVDAFAAHERLRFLPGTADHRRKSAFVSTCDAMLHARTRGETFGNSCAEFSACNRPVMTYALSRERSHIEILGEAALLYACRDEVLELLLQLDRSFVLNRSWDLYRDRFSPIKVMNRFKAVFLDNQL